LKEVVTWQPKCLVKGINGIGIQDLIIAQNNLHIYTLDKYFRLLNSGTDIRYIMLDG
jgi:hypothetical protein